MTSGSCEDTISQIPRTCCINVDENTYTSAPIGCHASVNKGTYIPKVDVFLREILSCLIYSLRSQNVNDSSG